MAAEADIGEEFDQWKYSIYLVAFPNTAGHCESENADVPVVCLISRLIPEARIFAYDIFQTNEDSTSVTSVAATRRLSPAWIEDEALALLETIRKNALIATAADRNKVLLAGYRFGVFVIKQAVLIANTIPKYYGIALNISSLVFFATPHRSSDWLAWDEILLYMIKFTKTYDRGQLLLAHSMLADSVSQLSHVFYRFAAKYPTSNFIEGKGCDNGVPVVSDLGVLSEHEGFAKWADKDINSLMFCAVDDLQKLDSLRTKFAPLHLLNQSTSEHFGGTTQVATADSYLEALQLLSPSRWILYETKTLDKPNDFSELKSVYRSLLSGIAWKDVLSHGSIQVTGPAGYGKAALVKVLLQEIRQRSSVVPIEHSLDFSERSAPTLYGVYVSFLHQIISQRPSLLLPIQNLMAEALRQESWTEESPWILLAAILRNSRAVDFLVVIYDFEDWPVEIQSWWSETLSLLAESCGLNFTFLTSSNHPINNLITATPHVLDLKERHREYRKEFVRSKTNNLLDHAYRSVSFGKGLGEDVKEKIISTAGCFHGSFTGIDTYLIRLFQTFTLNNLDAIVSDIGSSPQTEERLYELETRALRTKPPRILLWTSSVVSWILWSVRPLRIEELGAIVAVDLNDSSRTNFRSRISIDMERDLRSQLGRFVTLENRYARIKSALAREILSTDDTWKFLGLQDVSGLTKLCLCYITTILEDKNPEIWERCLSQVSWKHQTLNPRDPALEFLDYACRFWPTHFLHVEEPDSSLRDAVIKFLLDPILGQRWFQLYLLCICQSGNLPIGDQEAPGIMPEKNSLVGSEAIINPRDKAIDDQESAVRIACFLGLTSIIPEVSGRSVPARKLKFVNVRRGCIERIVAFSDTESLYYLDCAIANDDDSAVKELLDSDRARVTKYFPLHKAARAGCLRTAQTIYQLLDNPAQPDFTGRTPLHLAAISGSVKMIRFLLGKYVSNIYPSRVDVPSMIDIKDGNSQTPLIIASRMGNIEATKLLIEYGADFAICDGFGKTALHYAVFNCPEAAGDFASRDPASVCTKDNDGCNPLHAAARSGSLQAISTLLSALNTDPYLAAIHERDGHGKTPLHYAAENGYTAVVLILLQCEESTVLDSEVYQQAAELAAARGHLATLKLFISPTKKLSGDRLLEAASSSGQLLVVEYLLSNKLASPDGDQTLKLRPISLAASKGHNEVVRTLLRYKAAINIQDGNSQTPLHHAAEKGCYRVAETLLHHRANVNAPGTEWNTPLHDAAKAGWVNLIELLLIHGADIKAYSPRTKDTALHLAVKSPKAVRALLNANADRTATDMLGQTPLHMATSSGCYESACLLRWAGDIDAREDDGRPPLYYAIRRKDLTMVRLLCEERPQLQDSQDLMNSALGWAVEFSALGVLEFLLNLSSESVNKLSKKGRSIIHTAAKMESLEILIRLLECGADVNLLDSSRRTPLHDAAEAGRVQNMQNLIESGAEVNRSDGENQTPLFLAAYQGCVQAVEWLLAKDADVRVVTDEGRSPLHAAADEPEITMMLIEHGADVNLQKKDMWTPLHLATKWSETAVIEVLIAKGANLNEVNDDGETALHLAISNCDASVVQLVLNRGGDFKLKTNNGLSCLSLPVDKDLQETLDVLLNARSFSASGVAWDFEDMAAAYWRAMENKSMKCLDILVNKEGRLLDEFAKKRNASRSQIRHG